MLDYSLYSAVSYLVRGTPRGTLAWLVKSYMNQEKKPPHTGEEHLPKSFYFRTIRRIMFIFFLGFSLFLFISTIILIFLTKPEGEIEVPNVLGKRYIDVSNTIIRKELRPQLSYRNIYEMESGVILDQHPEPGAIVTTGSRIHLTLSRSNLFVEVPGVVGLELPFALNKLKNQHVNDRTVSLPVGVISYIPSEKIAENVVIDQSPRAGEKITLERKVNLLLSAGKIENTMEMPDVTGQSIDLCFTMLAAKGVYVQQSISNVHQLEAAGIVTSQVPARGAKINKGEQITLNVNYYRMEEHPFRSYEMVNYTIPADEKPGLYEAFVEDNVSKRLCYLAPRNPGQAVNFIFHRTGNAKVGIAVEKRVIKVFKFNVE